MMRALAMLMIDIGRGKSDVRAVTDALAGRDEHRSSRLAPPHGLCLIAVDYGETIGRRMAGKGEDWFR